MKNVKFNQAKSKSPIAGDTQFPAVATEIDESGGATLTVYRPDGGQDVLTNVPKKTKNNSNVDTWEEIEEI